MRLVLDTCALLTVARGDPIDAAAADAIRDAILAKTAYVPAVAALELGQKSAAGKVRLTGAATARVVRADGHAVPPAAAVHYRRPRPRRL